MTTSVRRARHSSRAIPPERIADLIAQGGLVLLCFVDPLSAHGQEARALLDELPDHVAAGCRAALVDIGDQALRGRYGVTVAPSYVFLRGGREVARLEGTVGPAALRAHLEFLRTQTRGPDAAGTGGAMSKVEFRHILCPTDFSEFSRRALAHALPLARWYGSKVTVMHVLPLLPPSVPVPPVPAYVPYVGPVPRAHLKEELQRFAQPATDAGLDVEVRLLEGNVTRSILEEARDAEADLIVLGTHGREGFERLVLGSVAEKVLRKATWPVMTVGEPAAGPPPAAPVLGRILCAVDFSRCSLRGLDYALSLAQEAKAVLHVLHVVEWAPDDGIREHRAPDVLGSGEFLVRDAMQRLREAIPEEARDWCQPEEVVSTGEPHAAILRVAREKGSELIVMGVRGRGAIDLALFGSTTHHVVREATCPVLTIRQGDPEK